MPTKRKVQSQCFNLLTIKAKANLQFEYFCVIEEKIYKKKNLFGSFLNFPW